MRFSDFSVAKKLVIGFGAVRAEDAPEFLSRLDAVNGTFASARAPTVDPDREEF